MVLIVQKQVLILVVGWQVEIYLITLLVLVQIHVVSIPTTIVTRSMAILLFKLIQILPWCYPYHCPYRPLRQIMLKLLVVRANPMVLVVVGYLSPVGGLLPLDPLPPCLRGSPTRYSTNNNAYNTKNNDCIAVHPILLLGLGLVLELLVSPSPR